MRNNSFIKSATVGFLISALVTATCWLLTAALDRYSAMALSLSIAATLYLIYLLFAGAQKKGSFSLLAIFLLTTFSLLLSAASLTVLATASVVWISLARSVARRQTILPSLLDLGLSVSSLVAAIFVCIHTQSVFLTFWSFFLCQSLVLPAIKFSRKCFSDQSVDLDIDYTIPSDQARSAFSQAHQNAESAINKLIQQ